MPSRALVRSGPTSRTPLADGSFALVDYLHGLKKAQARAEDGAAVAAVAGGGRGRLSGRPRARPVDRRHACRLSGDAAPARLPAPADCYCLLPLLARFARIVEQRSGTATRVRVARD